MGEHRSFWVWFSVLCAACALFSYMAVVIAIQGPAPSSLNVSTVRLASGMSTGSAIHIGNGYLLSAAHVVGSEKQMRVHFEDKSIATADVLWANTAKDVALLRFKDTGRVESSPLSCEVARPGTRVTAIGNPMNIGQLSFEGRINGPLTKVGDKVYLPADLAVMPGMSGGGAFDDEGNIVGIVVAFHAVRFGFMQASWSRTGLLVDGRTVCELLARVA